MDRTHRLGAETRRKNACRTMKAGDNQEEQPATGEVLFLGRVANPK
jgi:hypothetical protein